MKMGILVGGGPAPGINGVIGAAAIEAVNNDIEVLGFFDGFKHLTAEHFNPKEHVWPLSIPDVGRVHLNGGSILRTSRTSLIAPNKIDENAVVEADPQKVQRVLSRFKELGVTMLLTIGGDDTALSARFVCEGSRGAVRVAHVPKTIDNDLPLDGDVPTFGYTSARTLGTELVANLMEDSRTTGRWYLVQTMGRNAGFLALGIGKAAGATLTLIPEEFPGDTTVADLATIIEGAVLKRRVMGRQDGVAVIAEGLAYKLGDAAELSQMLGREVPVDAAGHPRLAEVPLANLLKDELTRRFKARGDKLTIVSHTLGYELRCARPQSYDLAYCRDLGHGGVRLLLDSQRDLPGGVMVTIRHGELHPVPFDSLVDPRTKRTRIRQVDLRSYYYEVARAYMIRLEPEDFDAPKMLDALAHEAKVSPFQFRKTFEPVVLGCSKQPGPVTLHAAGGN